MNTFSQIFHLQLNRSKPLDAETLTSDMRIVDYQEGDILVYFILYFNEKITKLREEKKIYMTSCDIYSTCERHWNNNSKFYEFIGYSEYGAFPMFKQK